MGWKSWRDKHRRMPLYKVAHYEAQGKRPQGKRVIKQVISELARI